MRDHKAHVFPVMAGMWGAKKDGIINLDFMCKNLFKYKNSEYLDDQKSLASFYHVMPALFMEHDDMKRFSGNYFPKHKPMFFGSFVGQRITHEDKEGRL